MKTLRRIVWLGLFAAAGVGLAIYVGSSPILPAGSQDVQRHRSATETVIRAEPEEKGRRPADTPPVDAQRAVQAPAAVAPSSPVVVVPYPVYAQQIVPESAKTRLEQINDLIQAEPALRFAPTPQEPVSQQRFPQPPVPQPPLPQSLGDGPPAADAKSGRGTIQASVSGEGDDQLAIDYKDADLHDVLLTLSEAGNLNILVNDSVTGKVSGSLKGVNIESALDAILKSTGYTALREGKFILVGRPEDFEDGTDLHSRVYHPRRVTAADLESLIEQLLTPGLGTVRVWKPAAAIPGAEVQQPDAEVVIVRDLEAVLAEIDKTVSDLDTAPAETGLLPVSRTVDAAGNVRLSLDVRDADIREVLDALGKQGNLNLLVGSNVQGTVTARLIDVDAAAALDAILKQVGLVAMREAEFTYVGSPADFESLEQAMDKIGTRIYRPNYVTAQELRTLITPLLTETVGVASASTPAEVGIGSDDSMAGGNSFAGADVVLVRDYEAVLAQIDQTVAEIDVRPLQVSIEVMILSVKLNDSNKFGVNFELLRNKPNVRLGWGTPLTSLAAVDFSQGGLKFGFLDGSLAAFLDALESIGDTNVIATPRVLVLNKHRAEIQIGEKKGYVSTTVTETSATQSVEFLDIGAQLRLRPFISSDGMIRMEIHPELSDGSVDTESGFTLPNKEITQVTTNIMVRDGCTVVIGGLMRDQLTSTTTQIPLLGNLPFIGAAFRTTTETIERREVLVLITPHIVYEPGTCREGDRAAAEFRRRQSVYADKMSPFGKRSIARRYFRCARSAWAVGDRNRALRFAEMSVHFDPLNRAAIDLRSDIWLGMPPGEYTLGAGARVGLTPDAMDGEAIDPWLLNDLEHEAIPPPAPVHPLDPGRPGSHTDIVRPRRLK